MTVLVVTCGVALVVSGIPLIWQYDPSTVTTAQLIHQSAGNLLIVLSMIIAVRAGLARLRRRHGHLRPLAAVGLLVLLLAAGITGLPLAWDSLATPSHQAIGDPTTGHTEVHRATTYIDRVTGETFTGPVPDDVPIPADAPDLPPERLTGTVAATQDNVTEISTDGGPIRQEDYETLSWAHLAIIPVLIALTYGLGRWRAVRREHGRDSTDNQDAAGNSDAESGAESGTEDATDEADTDSDAASTTDEAGTGT